MLSFLRGGGSYFITLLLITSLAFPSGIASAQSAPSSLEGILKNIQSLIQQLTQSASRPSQKAQVANATLPAWRQAMSQYDTLYNVSSGAPKQADPSLVFPNNVYPYGFGYSTDAPSPDAAWDVMSGYSSGALLEDVGGAFGTMVFGTGGHTRIQNQLLSLNLSEDSPSYGWYQQPYFETSAVNGAEFYYNRAEFNALPENRKTGNGSGTEVAMTEAWLAAGGQFPMGYEGWIFPKKMTYRQLGNNNPHGFRYMATNYIPASMTGTGAGAYVVVDAPQGPFAQNWLPSGAKASDLMDPSALWPSGRRKVPVWYKNTQTGAWNRITTGFEPDYAPYGYVRQHTAVARDQKRVYVSVDEANGTASYWYIDFSNGVANATISPLIRPTTNAAPNRGTTGAFTDGHPTGRHLWYWPDLSNPNGLIVQDMDAGTQTRLNIGQGLSIGVSESPAMQYDAANNRILLLQNYGNGVLKYRYITIPDDPLSAASYFVSPQKTLALDSTVATPIAPSYFYSKARYIPSLGVMLVPQDRGRMLAFRPSLPSNQPGVNLSASPSTIPAGASATLTWSAVNSTSCTASGGWSGTKATSGSQTVTPNTTTNYLLTCTGSGGSATESTTVTIGVAQSDPVCIVGKACYTYPSQAFEAATNGDVIEIAAGTYDGDVGYITASNLTIRGKGGRPHIRAAGANAGGKGIWVVTGNDTTIENIEMSGAAVSDQNGAAIRLEGRNITLKNVYFHHNENGLLGGRTDGFITILDSEFSHNGHGDGQSHNLYITASKLTMRGVWSHDANIGHLLKSRSIDNDIQGNRFTDENGTASYEAEFPNGGKVLFAGNIVEQSATTDNSTIIAYGAEGLTYPQNEFRAYQNTIVNKDDYPSSIFIRMYRSPTVNEVEGNVYAGIGAPTNALDKTVSFTEMTAPANYDFSLKTPISGTRALAQYAYTHPTSYKARSDTYYGAYPSTGNTLPVAPTVALTASPLSITQGQTATLSWSSTQSTSCAASGAWSGTKTTSGTETLVPQSTATYTLTCTGSGGSASQSVIVSVTPYVDTLPPTVSITTPSTTSTVSGTAVSVSAATSDNIGVAGVQFKANGGDLGPEDVTAPYGVTWDTTAVGDGTYSLTAVARDEKGNTTTSAPVTVTVKNTLAEDVTPPTVTLTAPTEGSTLSGTSVAVSAGATDNVHVEGVTFFLGSTQVGGEDTTLPYGILLDTTKYANGSYALTARARDTKGNTAISSAVAVSILNQLNPTDTTPPTIPQNLTALSPAWNKVNLSWSQSADNVAVTGYRIERCQGSGCTNFSEIGIATANGYRDSGLRALTPYSYRVRATDAMGNRSGYSSPVSVTTLAKTTKRPRAAGSTAGALIESSAWLTPEPMTSKSTAMPKSTTSTKGAALTISSAVQKGMRGADVATLQALLAMKGYLTSSDITGYFGPLTEAALKRFQCSVGIVCSGTPLTTGYGVTGPRTRALLQK